MTAVVREEIHPDPQGSASDAEAEVRVNPAASPAVVTRQPSLRRRARAVAPSGALFLVNPARSPTTARYSNRRERLRATPVVATCSKVFEQLSDVYSSTVEMVTAPDR